MSSSLLGEISSAGTPFIAAIPPFTPATPGVLIFWDASFSTATLEGCEGLTPKTYTTQARTFGVVSPPMPPIVPITPVVTTTTPPTATGSVSLASAVIAVQRGGISLVKLDCLGSSGCRGKLMLTAKSTVKAKEGQSLTGTDTVGGYRRVWRRMARMSSSVMFS